MCRLTIGLSPSPATSTRTKSAAACGGTARTTGPSASSSSRPSARTALERRTRPPLRRKRAVPEQRRSKVKRRRQPHPADRSVPHSLTEYGNVQPRLQRQQLLGADPPQKPEVRRAAAKRDVLAVVEPEAVALERE